MKTDEIVRRYGIERVLPGLRPVLDAVLHARLDLARGVNPPALSCESFGDACARLKVIPLEDRAATRAAIVDAAAAALAWVEEIDRDQKPKD